MKEKEDKRKKARKKLEEMNLLDDFLFGSVITYPEIGEKFARSLLKIIFGREFKYLSVTAQKVFYGEDSDLHGARLDGKRQIARLGQLAFLCDTLKDTKKLVVF